MYNINLSDEDMQFINEAASILMPMYKAQQFLARVNGQAERCKQEQKTQAQETVKAQIAEAVKSALADARPQPAE